MRPLREDGFTPVRNGDPYTDEHKEYVSVSLAKGFVRRGEAINEDTINFVAYVAVERDAIPCNYCRSCKNGLICKSQPVRILVCGTCSRRFLEISGKEGPPQFVGAPRLCQGFNWKRAQLYTLWACDVCQPRELNILDEGYAL
jgi:hypothetical protein